MKARRQTRATAQRAANRLGVELPAEVAEDSERAQSASRLAELLSEPDDETPAPASQPDKVKTYFLKPTGGAFTRERDYLEYLLARLTKFRRGGASFGQKFKGKITPAFTAKIVASKLGASIDQLAATRFAETVEHLQGKIDATILGKKNGAQGIRNYHDFEKHVQPEKTV